MSSDEQVFLSINEMLSGPWLTPVLSMITWLGDGIVLALMILPALFVFDRRRFKRHALPLVITVALSGGVVTVAKIVVDRPRPSDHFAPQGIVVNTPMGTPSDRSFPSGHSQTSMGTAVYLSCMYPPAAPLFLILGCLVGISRMALGVHYPLDVLVGALTGALFSIAGFRLNRFRLRKHTLANTIPSQPSN